MFIQPEPLFALQDARRFDERLVALFRRYPAIGEHQVLPLSTFRKRCFEMLPPYAVWDAMNYSPVLGTDIFHLLHHALRWGGDD